MFMKKKLVIIGVLVLLIIAGLAVLFITPKNEEEVIDVPEEIIEDKQEVIEEYSFKEEWNKNKKINDDYVGNIRCNYFDYPLVQAKGSLDDYRFYTNSGKAVSDYNACEGGPCSLNDVYLRMNWEDYSYALSGSIFMDYLNSLDDQNIIIYGHHYPKSMDPNRELFFTPLEKLMEKENYEDNKEFELLLEDEVRKYEVVYVYLFDVINDYDTLQYYRANYDYDYFGNPDPGYYEEYIEGVEKKKLYDTGISLTENDRTLTLQTCVENDSSVVEIVVAREIN